IYAIARRFGFASAPRSLFPSESGLPKKMWLLPPLKSWLTLPNSCPPNIAGSTGRLGRAALRPHRPAVKVEADVEILLAKDMGFCWGVRRAIDIMGRAAEERGEIISVGPIVHNPQVVEDLESKGVRTGVKPSDSSLAVAITAHGVGPQVLEEVRATG